MAVVYVIPGPLVARDPVRREHPGAHLAPFCVVATAGRRRAVVIPGGCWPGQMYMVLTIGSAVDCEPAAISGET